MTRSIIIRIIAIAATMAALLTVAGVLTVGDTTMWGMRHSCGYHCNPDGSHATPASPPTTIQVQPVGRYNVHSGGRLHGSANKRVGCGGCNGHPA